MQPADLIFIRGTEGLAGPIKKITRSPYTHIAGITEVDQVIESQAGRRTGYAYVHTYEGVSDVYACPRLTPEERHRVVEYAMQRMGVRYDYLLFSCLAFRHVIGSVVPLYASKRRQICSTLWVDAYRAVGIDLCPGIEYPTPGELAQSELLEHVGSF